MCVYICHAVVGSAVFATGQSPPYWPNEAGEGVPVHHRQHGGGEDCGAC